MRKTEGTKKAAASYGYCKHLKPEGKRMVNKAVRRHTKLELKKA